MLNYNDNTINYEIINSNTKNIDGTEVCELIIRGEKNRNTEGISIKNKKIDELNEIIDNIKELILEDVIKYLNNNKTRYQNIQFM